MAKKRIMIDDVISGGLVNFSQGEFDDPPESTDKTRKPELEVFIRGEFWRQTTAEECAAMLIYFDSKVPEIEQYIMTRLNDEGIRTATTALHMLLTLRNIK